MTDLEEASDTPHPRIAMVSIHGYVAAKPSLGAADTGGQVIYVLELSKKLAQMGYAVDIFTRRFENQNTFEKVDEHVRIVRIPCGGKDFIPKEYMYEHAPEWVDNTLTFIRQHNLSYKFINSHYWDAGVASELLSNKLGTPHVHTPHSLGQWKLTRMSEKYDKDPETLEKKYNFTNRIKHEKKVFQSALAVTATSPVQADILKKEYGIVPQKTTVIPPGYDETRFFPVSQSERKAIRKRWGAENKKVVITLGRIASNKGYDLLIDAFKYVAEREPDAELHMAVGGKIINEEEQKMLDELKEQAEQLGIRDRLVFRDFIPDEDLADFYRMGDVFVLSSRYEPFGMTAIEAMACGTPSVITTRGGLWKDLEYGVDSLFADVMDKEDFGITIEKLFRYPELSRRLSKDGSKKVHSMFTWTQISQQLIEFINKRINKTRGTKKVAASK